jgi:hypothetical protein
MAATLKNLAMMIGLAAIMLWTVSSSWAGTNADEARKTRLIVSGVVFGVTYAGTIIGDRAIDSSVNFSQLYVPAIGPFLALGAYDDKVDPDYSGRSRDKVLFVLSGAVQTASLIVFALNLKSKDSGKAGINLPEVLSSLSVAPNGRGGFVAGYRFRF